MTTSLRIHKQILEVPFIFLLSWLFFVGQPGQLSAQGIPDRLRPISFKPVLDFTDQTVTLEERVLEMSRIGFRELGNDNFKIQDYRERIDKMAKELSGRLQGSPKNKINVINQYLFRELGFQIDPSDLLTTPLSGLLMNQVIDKKRGTCLTMSILYLALGQHLNLPFYGVQVPGHFFVRYDDGKEQINIETTRQGEMLPDDYYLQTYFYGQKSQSKYLKNLNDREVVAVYLSNLGNQYKMKGLYDRAIDILGYALDLAPDFPAIVTNLGNAYERKGEVGQAILEYTIAIGMNPYLCEAHYNLGLAHFIYTKNEKYARLHGQIAQQLGCSMAPQFVQFLNSKP